MMDRAFFWEALMYVPMLALVAASVALGVVVAFGGAGF
jgi:hypothetical protein